MQLSTSEMHEAVLWLTGYDFDYEIDYDDFELLVLFQSEYDSIHLDLSHREVRCLARANMYNSDHLTNPDLRYYGEIKHYVDCGETSQIEKDGDDIDILIVARFLLILENKGFDYVLDTNNHSVKIKSTSMQGRTYKYFEVSNFIMKYHVEGETEIRNNLFLERYPNTTNEEFNEALEEYENNKNSSAVTLYENIMFNEFNQLREENGKNPISIEEWYEL